ncbi:MAG: hypothetical protein M3R24_40300 [Chloroflexota bacterium]|nr:hypothetical protein [Chloroflexota bacterium]
MLSILLVQFGEGGVNLGIDISECPFELLGGKIAGAVVHGCELAAINHDQFPTEELQLFTAV